MSDLRAETDRLLALADAVGPSSFATAEISEDGAVECPLCSGEGYIEAETAINIDQRAVTMQFYGVGDDFSRYSALWEAVPSMADHLRALQAESERLTAENEALRRDADRYKEWKRAFREGECGFFNALCDAQTNAEHDAVIDAAISPERKP